MTFAEYNTDENFNDKDSSLKELVEIGKGEGKTLEEIKSNLSPKWKTSKKLGEIDSYYGVTTPTKTTTTTPAKSTISNFSKSFMGDQNGIANAIKESEMAEQAGDELKIHKANAETYKRMGENFGNIDDKMIAQIPTFMIKRYKNGEFGEPGSTDAKLRLGHFILSNFQSGLKNASNAFSIAAGRGPMFQDTMSDYDKYQQTNLAKGLENRWKKYDAETQAAVDMAVKEGADEQEMRNSIRKVTSSARLNSAFKQMDENQKRNMLYVVSALGDQIGKLDNEDLINTLIGFAVSGENLSWQEAAEVVAAKLGKDGFKSLITGGGKDKLDGVEEITAGLGGGNAIKSVTLSDGTTFDPGTFLTKPELKQIQDKADELIIKYDNGEITKEQFESDYGALYDLANSHKFSKAFNGSVKPIDTIYKMRGKAVEKTRLDGVKDGKKSLEYFNKNPKVFEYFNGTEEPNFIDAKKTGIKDMKEYTKILNYYTALKDANVLDLVGKYK